MTTPPEFDDKMAIFASAMSAVALKLVRATARPSIPVVVGEVLLGLTFCFIIAPAVQEYYHLSLKLICALTWIGALFSGILLQGAENVIKAWIEKVTPNDNDNADSDH